MADKYYGTGHRKNAIARVWLSEGPGKVTINSRSAEEYLRRPALHSLLEEPFQATGNTGRFDVSAKVIGGGISGQAGAIRHGIARALLEFDENLRPALRKSGLLTRDSRVKERKKYGRKRARRGFQFSKR